MMKKILLISFLMGICAASAQSYIGFLSDNYSGVHQVTSNPASIVGSKYRADINLAGVSGFFGNDYYGVKFGDFLKDSYDIDVDAIETPLESNNLFGNFDVLGPAVLFNINEKNSLAVFSRARANLHLSDVNGGNFRTLLEGIDETEDYFIDEGVYSGAFSSWSEIGLTYATVLVNNEKSSLKGGLSLKYLQGYQNAYSTGEDITIDYDADGITITNGFTTGSISSTGTINYGYTENLENGFEEFVLKTIATGFGFDLGLNYDIKPNSSLASSNIYKLKLGVSITDIGSLSFTDGTEISYDISATVDQDDLENQDELQEKLNNLYTETERNNLAKYTLPTALNVNADYHVNGKFFLNLNSNMSLNGKQKANAGRIINRTTLTPRIESRWFSVYSPISIVQHMGFQWGFGFRAGPVYMGSGSIISALSSKQLQGTDFYAGLKIPIYSRKSHYVDLNSSDDSKETFDTLEEKEIEYTPSQGDRDGDGITDSEDKCPLHAGPKSNDGCPEFRK